MTSELPINATDVVHTAFVVDSKGDTIYVDSWPTSTAALTWAMHQLKIEPTATFAYVQSEGYTDDGNTLHTAIAHVHGSPDLASLRYILASIRGCSLTEVGF